MVKRVYGRMFAYGIPATIDGQEGTVDLISYEINQFGWASGSLLEGSIDESLNGNGLLALYGNGTTRHTGQHGDRRLWDGHTNAHRFRGTV